MPPPQHSSDVRGCRRLSGAGRVDLAVVDDSYAGRRIGGSGRLRLSTQSPSLEFEPGASVPPCFATSLRAVASSPFPCTCPDRSCMIGHHIACTDVQEIVHLGMTPVQLEVRPTISRRRAARSKLLPLSLSRSSLMSLKFPFSFTSNRLACSRSALNKSVLRLPSIETYPISHLFKHFSKSGVSKIFRKLSCAFCGCSEFPYNPDDTIILNGVKHLMESLWTLLFCIRCLKVGRSKVSDLTVLYQVSEIRVES